ncbi:hypothetical protein ONE63_005160 [Megalurothrips usitatus]|uniref:Transposable element P transposase n=1 Tax=Megalurothrips usitatus TaxID=439358 RepID=A0AAV7XXZ7_9NEOP|nr:hypothetical protein ONE63_005160 [Megalurothrips usitatus]
MNKNTEKMTAIEKLFWEQQSLALSKREKSKGMRWHPTMIRLALQLRMLSPAAYDFMRDAGFLCLPSQRRLFDYSQFTEAKEGVQQEILDLLMSEINAKCPEEYQKYFNLLLDEMSIRSDLVYNSGTGELVGFTNLTSVEEELASLEAEIRGDKYEKKLAKKVLVFMLNGAVNDIRRVVAIYSTDDLSAAQLYVRTWEVIYLVEEAGAKVLCSIFDGASMNRKFITMHSNSGDTDFVYVTYNMASGECRNMYFMLDPPHLVKTFRNCFANSFCHRNSRALCINDKLLSWKAIQSLFLITKEHKYKGTKLTDAHVHLTSFSCMRVSLAVQVFSNSVAKALQTFKDNPKLKEYYNEELVDFILKMNRWFDCMNASEGSKKKHHNADLLEYVSVHDERFTFLEKEFLKYLQQWEDFVERQNNLSKEKKSKMIISYQSLEGIKITTLSFIKMTKFLLNINAPKVSARKFNQEPLEQYFSDQRRVRGDDNNPNLKQFLHSNLSLQSALTVQGKRGNREDVRNLQVDASPLPVRKKARK